MTREITSRLKSPDGEARWVLAQRLFTLDSPASRWRRTRDLFVRSCRQAGASARESTRLKVGEIDSAMGVVYGGAAKAASRLINFNLALEDIARFDDAVFEAWVTESTVEGRLDGDPAVAVSRWMGAHGYSAADTLEAETVCRWLAAVPDSTGSPAAALWVVRSTLFGPDWSFIRKEGPWSSDRRAQFLAELLEILSETAASPQGARELFLKKLSLSRSALPGSFLPRLIVLVEGQTEALLVPYFGRLAGLDLDAEAVMVMPAGGSNQVVRRFIAFRDSCRLPVVVVLDADAKAQAAALAEMLRDGDSLHVLSEGEIEDVFDEPTLIRLVNEHLSVIKLVSPVSSADLALPGRRTEVLNRIWRERGLGDFDKIGFARTIIAVPDRSVVVPDYLRAVFRSVSGLLSRRSER